MTTIEEMQARIYELEDAMRVIMDKAGSHAVKADVRLSDDERRADPGFAGIYFVAGEALLLWGRILRPARILSALTATGRE